MSDSTKQGMAISALAVAFITFLGIALRCRAIGAESAWGDEALTAVCFPAEGFWAYLQCVFAEDARLRLAPVYYWVQYGWSVFFGGELVSLRYLSVALNFVASLQLFFLVQSMGGRRAGLWALFLFNVSLFEIYFGQEVRFYALMNVFALAAMQGALWYARGRLRCGLGLAVAGNAGLVWTHTFAVVFVLGLGLYMLRYARQPSRLLPWYGAHGAMALGLVGWLAWLRYDLDGQSAAYGDMPAGWRELANTFLQFSGGRFSNINPAPHMPGGISLDLPIAVGVLLLAGYAVWRAISPPALSADSGPRGGDIFLLLTCLAAPVLLLFALGWLWRPCFFTRYAIYSALPLYALGGLGLGQIANKNLRHLAGALAILLFAWQVLALPRPFRADYVAVARYVAADSAEEKVVLALKPFNYDAVAYALRDSGVETVKFYGLKEIAGIAAQRAGADVSVWVVFYRWDDLAGFESRMEAEGLVFRRFETSGMPPLDLYQVTSSRSGP